MLERTTQDVNCVSILYEKNIFYYLNFIFKKKTADCPKNMIEFRDEECIAVLKDPKSFDEAEKECNNKYGGSLFSLKDADDLEEIAKIAPATDNLVYIGASDQALEGHFAWNDHSANTYFPWKEGEPERNNTKKNCVALDSGAKFRLTTEVCSIPHPFFCSISKWNLDEIEIIYYYNFSLIFIRPY